MEIYSEETMANGVCKTKPPNRLAGDEGFKDKSILLTGVTGFLGKVLLEKLLRTCPLLKKIYVIVRNKKGNSIECRLNDMFKNPLFDLLIQKEGKAIFDKVVPIPGDFSETNLGLSQTNWELLANEVEIIFHLAATVRFDEPLKKAILLNTRGTKLLLNLAQECRKLLIFVHVSTAYCYPQEKLLYEKMYPPPANPDDIIKLVEILDQDSVDLITQRLKGSYPNGYAYTKALAEGLVNNEMDKLPVIILRPSVVVPVWSDPLPGWTDNLNGPAGLLAAAGKGVCRTMYCSSNKYADFIPVDIVANCIMLATYDYMVHKNKRVFNLTSSSKIRVSYSELVEVGRRLGTSKIPFNWIVWYPGGSIKSSKWVHNICVILFHYIPAVVLDSLIILTGNKPILWKVQRRISKGFDLFEYYANNQWDFSNDDMMNVIEQANETEKEIYKANEEGFDVEKYCYNAIRAIRLYIFKESDESLPTAKRHLMVMWAVDRICKFLFCIGFGYLLMKYFIYPVLEKEI